MNSLSREHQDFNVGLKAFIKKDEKLLVLKETEGKWELPGGRSLDKILLRETREELGEDFKLTVEHVFHTWIREADKGVDFYLFLVGFKCEYMEGEITLSPEHEDFCWIDKEEIEQLEFVNTYQEAIEQYFAECAT